MPTAARCVYWSYTYTALIPGIVLIIMTFRDTLSAMVREICNLYYIKFKYKCYEIPTFLSSFKKMPD